MSEADRLQAIDSGPLGLHSLLALLGAASGLALWALVQATERGWLADRPAIFLIVWLVSGTAAHMAFSGRMGQVPAAIRGVALGLLTGALAVWSTRAFADAAGTGPLPALALITGFHLALPFLILQGRGQRALAYEGLFLEAWALFQRIIAGFAFLGLVWAVLGLSDLLLRLVGIGFLDFFWRWDGLLALILSGGVFGLGLAVMLDLGAPMVPAIALRLLRLLVPVLIVVVAVFLLALPFRGLSRIFGELSAGATFLALTFAMTTFATSAVERDAGHEVTVAPMRLATRGLMALTVVPAVLAAWAVMARVGQYGWTPERLLAAFLAALALGYGLTYLVAALRGSWAADLRRANVAMALATIALTLVWTGLLNPEALAARSQVARYESGSAKPADLDIWAFDRWGTPGEAALKRLEELSASDPDLAAALDNPNAEPVAPTADELATLRAELAGAVALQPAGATALRDAFLQRVEPWVLQSWADACRLTRPDAGETCVMVIGDFLTDFAGEEAIFANWTTWEGVDMMGWRLTDDGVTSHSLWIGGQGYGGLEATVFLDTLAATPPSLAPAPANVLTLPEGSLQLAPNP